MTRLWPDGERLAVWGGEETTPAGFSWQGMAHTFQSVHNRWRVHTRWWAPEGALWREYIKVTTDTGLLCLLYRDLNEGGWFLARVYD
jgi:hypothetical protein